MALNYIWIGFFLVAFIVAVIKVVCYYNRDFFVNQWGWEWVLDPENAVVFSKIVESTFDMAEVSVEIALYLAGIMTLWLGLMKIGERGGAVEALAKLVNPFFHRLFPNLPNNHPAYGSMLMNFSANILGLDNAATPLGLKAMDELQEANTKKDTASDAQIMFLVLNTSGLTVIPISVMALRAAAGAANPADVFLPILLATFFSTLTGLVAVALFQRLNLFNKVILAYLAGGILFIAGIIWYFSQLSDKDVERVSSLAGNSILFGIIVAFIIMAMRRRVNIFETFVEGAKEGFHVAVKIIPYLVAMLVAIGVFRASGAMDGLIAGIAWVFEVMGVNTDFVPALPTALMKPLSGSGARGMMVEAMETYGADSFVGRLASTFQGSTETTFYVLAVYFGAVGITRTRYALACGLIADLAGIIAAIFIAYIFFH